jgi:hypothetical protein
LITTRSGLFKLILSDERQEGAAHVLGDRRSRSPLVVGGASREAVGPSELVATEAGGLDVVERPLAGTVVTRCFVVRADLVGADACLHAPVEARSVERRSEVGDAPVGEERQDLVGDEMRPVVGLHAQGVAMLGEEGAKDVDRGLGVVVLGRHGGERVARREVADAEDRLVGALDDVGRRGVVHGPDRAGMVPRERVDEDVLAVLMESAVAVGEIDELAPGHVGEERVEGGHADLGPAEAEDRKHGETTAAVGVDRGSATWFERELILFPPAEPGRECGLGDVELLGRLERREPVLSLGPVGELNGGDLRQSLELAPTPLELEAAGLSRAAVTAPGLSLALGKRSVENLVRARRFYFVERVGYRWWR